jgi:hypothetical protein
MSIFRYSAYTSLDWTITGYYFPSTTEYHTLTARSTPILTFRLLPASDGGGLLLANNKPVDTDEMPKQMGNVFLKVATDKTGANIIFTEISGIITFDTTMVIPSLGLGSSVTALATNIPTLPFDALTTPAAPRPSVAAPISASTSLASKTTSGTNTRTDSLDASNTGSRKPPGLSGGAIAGISIAVICAVLLWLGVWIMFRRRWKTRDTSIQSDVVSFKRASDKMVVSSRDGNSSHPLRYPGSLETACMPNIVPSQPRGSFASAHELRADTGTSELSPRSPVEISPLSPIEFSVHLESAPNIDITTADASPHVEAQRKREVEWLENEEAKLRQRREQLMQQVEEHRMSSESVG